MNFFKILFRVVPLRFKLIPVHTIVTMLISVFHALSFTAGIIATQKLFDAITDAAGGKIGFTECVIPLLILAAVTFGQQIINGLHNFYFVAIIWPVATGRFKSLLHRKMKRIDPASFEDTTFLDELNKAKEGVWATQMFAEIPLMIFAFYGVYFGSVGAYLYNLKPILLITIMVAFIPSLLGQIVRAKVFTHLEEESAPIRRENEYYQRTLCDREYFKETRILGAYQFFHQLFSETLTLLTKKVWQAERKTALLELLLNVASFIGMATATYLLFTATMAGEITVGAFAAVYGALGMIFSIMQQVINLHISEMNKNIGKVANFVKMLDMPEQTGVWGKPDFALGVVAEDISFTYPGRDEAAVKDVSLKIEEGETIAIVGENGAGKSTLVRLLTGVYQPSRGKVMVGGLCTCETASTSVFKGISGVFQKYQRYKMTLAENVSISDIKVGLCKQETELKNQIGSDLYNLDAVTTALTEAEAGLDIPLDTMLSPEFDGIDLSGGQWQRLAIARGLYRANGFIVLDEPTSAIDPIEETRIYKKFQQLAKPSRGDGLDKIAIVVTHRLGSTKLADRIIVMDGGKIVDAGTHDELVSHPGKYAEMWSAQAKWYERENIT